MKLPLGRSALLLTTAVATLAVSLPSTALAHPKHSKVKEYSLAEFAVPADLTTGPDGALYAPDGSLDRLWRVTTKGKVSHIDVPGGPAGVATGKDGALWVTARTTDQIHRVTTKGQITSYQLPEDPTGKRAFPTDIVAGPDGALWFTESSGNKVGRITTKGELTEYLGAPGSQPTAIVTGRDRALYIVEANANAIARMNTKGEVTRRSTLPIVDSTPVSLAPTRHGVYVSQHSTSSIGFMSYGGYFGRPVRTKSEPDAITIGPDGNLWYASGNGSKIGRIDIDR